MIPFKTFQNLSKEKQNRITQAAIEEFSNRGYSGASINSIVKKVGIAKGSIFQYFGDKNRFFSFIFSDSMEKVKQYLREIRDNTTNDDLFTRLEKTLFAGVIFIKENPLIYKLYVNILSDSQIPFRNKLILSLHEYSFKYIKSLLKTAHKKGEINKEISIEKAAFVIDSVMDRFLQARVLPQMEAGLGIYNADDETIYKWVHDIISIIRCGISYAHQTKKVVEN